MNNSSLANKCFWLIIKFSAVKCEPHSKQNQTDPSEFYWNLDS